MLYNIEVSLTNHRAIAKVNNYQKKSLVCIKSLTIF